MWSLFLPSIYKYLTQNKGKNRSLNPQCWYHVIHLVFLFSWMLWEFNWSFFIFTNLFHQGSKNDHKATEPFVKDYYDNGLYIYKLMFTGWDMASMWFNTNCFLNYPFQSECKVNFHYIFIFIAAKLNLILDMNSHKSFMKSFKSFLFFGDWYLE